MRRQTIGAALAAATLLAAPGAARAHVTLQPGEAPAKGFVVETVRVPNEKDDAATTKVQVKFPPGFSSVSHQPVPGWSATVRTKQLDEPIETEDGPITVGVDTVTWTADSRADGIQPGQFQEFPLSLLMPDEPAATITLTDAVADAGGHGATASTGGHEAMSATDGDADDHESHLALAGFVAGLLGLLAGGIALLRTRRPRERTPAPTTPGPGT